MTSCKQRLLINTTVFYSVTLITVALFLTSCSTVNPFNTPTGHGAILENTYASEQGEYFGFFFRAADRQAKGKDFVSLRPGFITAEREAVYTIPAGRCGIKLVMVYAPEGVGAFKPQFHMWGYVVINAVAGQRYRGRGQVTGNKSLIWIEDDTGRRVSDKVEPFLNVKMI